MTWKEIKKTLTTPPPPRPPSPKYPLFTSDPFSTTSFGPGHLIGAGVLVLGLYGLTKFVVGRGRALADATRKMADQPQIVRRPEDDPQIVQAENQRGQYEKRGP